MSNQLVEHVPGKKRIFKQYLPRNHVANNVYVVFVWTLTVLASSGVSWDAAHIEYTGTPCRYSHNYEGYFRRLQASEPSHGCKFYEGLAAQYSKLPGNSLPNLGMKDVVTPHAHCVRLVLKAKLKTVSPKLKGLSHEN